MPNRHHIVGNSVAVPILKNVHRHGINNNRSVCCFLFQFQAYSEARIMNGLLWLLLQNINGQTRNQLQQFNIRQFFDELGITSRLSETRLNGLKQIEEILHNL